MHILDHVSISVPDLDAARPFYDAVMAALGVAKVYDRAEALGYGKRCSAGEVFHSYLAVYLSPVANLDPYRHWCFKAASRAQVRDFHAAGLAHGGKDDGAPGLRPHYHADYYGAFLLDPFGNRVEAVCHRAETEAGSGATIGLIGGMSWESTVPYYRLINEGVKQRLGGLHSARIVLHSVDFHDIERLQHAGDWDAAGALLADAARKLEDAGASFIVLCTNTMHKVAAAIEAAVTIPLLHIADPTANAVKQAGIHAVGLLGTRFTMEEEFYRGRLEAQHGLRVVIPDAADRDIVHRVIYDELCLGVTKDDSRAAYRAIIGRLVAQGAQGIILGCTEIGLLVKPEDSPVPLFDTTALHAGSAVARALGEY